jgi:HEAT repeat protein
LKILGVSQLYTQAQRPAQMTREQIEADNRRTAQEREEAARRAREEAEWERLRSGAGRSALQEEDLRQARLGLSAGSWEVRRSSVRKLEGVPGDDVTILIVRTMLDSDSDVRAAAYSVASRRPLRSPQLLETLENVYSRSGSWESRRHVVYLLTPLKDFPMATSMLISILHRDSDSDVQTAAYSAVATHSLSSANVDALFTLARSGSWEKRRRAVWLMAKLPSMDVYRFLGDMLARETDSDVKSAISSTLASMRRSLE